MEEKLIGIYNALNQLKIEGIQNCSIVGAIASTLEQIIKDLESEKKDDMEDKNDNNTSK